MKAGTVILCFSHFLNQYYFWTEKFEIPLSLHQIIHYEGKAFWKNID
jgi:hypothetical protein